MFKQINMPNKKVKNLLGQNKDAECPPYFKLVKSLNNQCPINNSYYTTWFVNSHTLLSQYHKGFTYSTVQQIVNKITIRKLNFFHQLQLNQSWCTNTKPFPLHFSTFVSVQNLLHFAFSFLYQYKTISTSLFCFCITTKPFPLHFSAFVSIQNHFHFAFLLLYQYKTISTSLFRFCISTKAQTHRFFIFVLVQQDGFHVFLTT